METVEYNPDGSIKKITFRTAGIASSEAPTCPKCGKKATWVEEYKRWYCYDCKDYL
jgi:ribosomal protein L37AE/L43A